MFRQKDQQASAGSAVFIFGIIIVFLFFIIPLVINFVACAWYDTPEEAWDEVEDSTISASIWGTSISAAYTDVKFVGTVSKITDSGFLDLGLIYIDGFDAPVFFRNTDDIEAGDSVIVKGEYASGGFGSSSVNGVMGGMLSGTPKPADVSKVWWRYEICTTIMWIGAGMVVIGIPMHLVEEGSNIPEKGTRQLDTSWVNDKDSSSASRNISQQDVPSYSGGLRETVLMEDDPPIDTTWTWAIAKEHSIIPDSDFYKPVPDFCIYCGSKIESGSDFCIQCGKNTRQG